ncbi:MAG TPA: gas vesicle protein K [Chloroflexota bacterium]|nr:gas vesicle protein K [Chloroflexota bacterium]
MQALPRRVNAQPDDAGTGLAKLVLSLIEFLRQLLERQAVRRMDAGDLSEEDVERMGLTLMQLEQKMSELTQQFGLSPQDLNLDLGPLGRLL